ncbi:MAG: glycosyltransferase family 2 protein [Candidatus Micrarchaeota archaeon]|nr:glycosyltransferase family 2 protein [Candidatus Micrarchaeota archaeon]
MLTVIVPAYNSERMVERTLDSIVKQKNDMDTEIIVMDDCSRDNTGKVARKFLSRQNVKYKVVRNVKNLGLAKSINKGIGLSDKKNNFVMIVEDDTALKGENWLKRAMKHFKDKHVAVVTGKYLMPKMDGLDLISKFCSLKYFRQTIRYDGVYDISIIEERCNIYRKDVLTSYLFNPRYRISGEDQDLVYKLNDDGYKIIYDSSLTYESLLSNQQNSYKRILRHEAVYAISQVSLNLRYWDSIKRGTRDSNLTRRMMFRLVQVLNVLLTISLLILQRWDVLILLLLLRLIYSVNSYYQIHKNLFEVVLFSLFDYFTDFAYFSGVLSGIFKVVSSNKF